MRGLTGAATMSATHAGLMSVVADGNRGYAYAMVLWSCSGSSGSLLRSVSRRSSIRRLA